MTYHISCGTLSIGAFLKIMETGDYCYLAKNPYSNFVIDTGRERLSEVWSNIYKEYCELTNDNRSLEYYRLKQELLYLETRKAVASKILVQITMRKMPNDVFMEYIKELKAWGYKYNAKKMMVSELENLSGQIKFSQNRINLTNEKLESFKNTGRTVDIEEQALKIEYALGKDVVDPWNTSVKRWVKMCDQIAEINRNRQKRKNSR